MQSVVRVAADSLMVELTILEGMGRIGWRRASLGKRSELLPVKGVLVCTAKAQELAVQ